MKITLAEPKDLKEINQLFEAAKRQMIQADIHQWTTAYPNEQIVQKDINDHLLYQLVDGDTIVAVATLNKTRKAEYIVRRIATDPNYLSNGYASILLNDIINRAKEKNGKYIYSSTNHSNLKMQHFFKKHGFEKISEYTEIEREHLGSFYKYLKKI
ncbi:hypothetical protein ATZ33_08820 [Enterococcus silesiacus]|uniref:N-acetyltransferase domain-containing protein n=1 Tax=Enterococcus silesiacus TaxID=332949 RepID=A0A0S3KB33_9ENTE|nr:GNAT family N-acetyltransferase [Enterococcus silesiacus]ALS01464.1 hypothetical protein ATZ33_08820 [Enterococcus silesiacus]OJG87737.1 hypothetical protein RV15_GL001870 [Enterococcus silesiacus]